MQRFPRLTKSAEDKLKAERAALEDEALEVIGSFHTMKVKLGRIFIRIKATLKHGEWERYYEKAFGTSGVSFRSAERYMVRAIQADADSLTILKSGMSPEAQETHGATVEAQAEIGDAPKPEPVYRLALHLSADKRDATIRLWKSPHRHRAERKIVGLLGELLIKFGAFKDESADDDKEAR